MYWRIVGLLLIIAIVSVNVSGCISGDDEPNLLEIAENDVLDNLREGNYEEAYALFNEDMKGIFSLSDLEVLWDSLVFQYGNIVDIQSENGEIELITEDGKDYEAVFIPCEFESGATFNIEVVFDMDNMVAGIWVLPT